MNDCWLLPGYAQSCYRIPALNFLKYGVKTHTPSNTPMRGPAAVNGHAMIENIIEHAAAELQMDPVELRLINQLSVGDTIIPQPLIPPPVVLETQNPIPNYVAELKQTSDYDARVAQLEEFNKVI